MDYPKYQWSYFLDNQRNSQIVVRANDTTEMENGIVKALELIEKIKTTTGVVEAVVKPSPQPATAQPQVQPQPQSQISAMTSTFSEAALLPYGRVKLPQNRGKYGSGNYLDSWMTNNKIADYAEAWRQEQRQKQPAFLSTFKNVQAPDGYDKAQTAMDRLFGSETGSGNSFKQTFGPAVNNKFNVKTPKFNTNPQKTNKPKGFVTKNNVNFQKKLKTNMNDGKVKSKTKRAASKFLKMMR